MTEGRDPAAGRGERPEEQQEPVVRDKRRIDPLTGELRAPQPAAVPSTGPSAAPSPAPSSEEVAAPTRAATTPDEDQLAAALAERTADLQRLSADFANYRKRVERDRLATQEMALANVLANLLPVLDDIGRAREHGELEGGFRSVAEALEATVAKLGLAPFGEAGELFDPVVHEALTHTYSADVTEPTCVAIFQPGYRLGERVLRPARVAVAEPSGDRAAAETE
ncbi:MAG: nucleotide exchange factor GrpE [Frankiaceae bacterium]